MTFTCLSAGAFVAGAYVGGASVAAPMICGLDVDIKEGDSVRRWSSLWTTLYIFYLRSDSTKCLAILYFPIHTGSILQMLIATH